MTRSHSTRLIWFLAAGAALFLPLQAAFAVESPVTAKLLKSDIVVDPDGTFVQTDHGEFLARNKFGGATSGPAGDPVQRFDDRSRGRRGLHARRPTAQIPVEASAIFTQLPQGATNVPSFNDQRQKVIVFPNVAAGDLVVYTTRQHMKHPFFPGYFIASDALPRTLSIDAFQGSLSYRRACRSRSKPTA